MTTRRTIYSFMTSEDPGKFRPRIRFHGGNPDGGPYSVLELAGADRTSFDMHATAGQLRTLRDTIDDFLASEDGRRLAEAEATGPEVARYGPRAGETIPPLIPDGDGLPIVPAKDISGARAALDAIGAAAKT